MGQGQEVKTRDDAQVEVQERGDIFFFYRPKVGREAAQGADDVRRLYIVLRPESGEEKPVEEKQDPHEATVQDGQGSQETQEVNIKKQPLLRYIVMGKKSLPDPSKRSLPHWGFVEMVTTNIDAVKSALKEEEYDTATRGHRREDRARALGEGVYRIVRHKFRGKRAHTHLVYRLEFPPEDEEREAQEALNVHREGSFIVQIKNPEQQHQQQGKRKAVFPAHLQGKFGRLRFGPADPPELLNYEGCELLLISASDDIDEELGIELIPEGEGDPSCSDLLKMFGDTVHVDPLLRGTWV